MSHNYLVQLSYSGDSFLGFQKSKEGPSVEEELTLALEKILKHPVKIQATSRTDKGVHAEDQYINFHTDKPLIKESFCQEMNSILPLSISINNIETRPYDFHPTLNCIKKRYRYQFSLSDTPYHYRIPSDIDIELMKEACKIFIGTHCFYAFCCRRGKYESFERTLLDLSIQKHGDSLHLKIEGVTFMNKMVRMIASALVLVGNRSLTLKELKELLSSKKSHPFIDPLQANALFLEKIFY